MSKKNHHPKHGDELVQIRLSELNLLRFQLTIALTALRAVKDDDGGPFGHDEAVRALEAIESE